LKLPFLELKTWSRLINVENLTIKHNFIIAAFAGIRIPAMIFEFVIIGIWERKSGGWGVLKSQIFDLHFPLSQPLLTTSPSLCIPFPISNPTLQHHALIPTRTKSCFRFGQILPHLHNVLACQNVISGIKRIGFMLTEVHDESTGSVVWNRTRVWESKFFTCYFCAVENWEEQNLGGRQALF
jgi:hypothetical protein